MRKPIVFALIMTLALMGLSAPAHSKTFKNCTDLRKVYKFGVAQTLPIRNVGAGQIETPRINRSVYLANKRLDLDKDGIACEVLKRTATKPTPIASPSEPAAPINIEPISFDNLDPKRTWADASAKVRAAVKPFDSTTLGIRYVLAPSVSPELVARETKGIDRIAGLWSTYFLPNQNVRFIYVSPGDASVAAQITEREQNWLNVCTRIKLAQPDREQQLRLR
jgi:hypothetical protein